MAWLLRFATGFPRCALAALSVLGCVCLQAEQRHASAQDAAPVTKACIDGEGPGWKTLTADDFERVNLEEDTWTWDGTLAKCTGKPVGVTRTREQLTNFELVAQWRHLSRGGNSGIFIWAAPEGMVDLPPGRLPKVGIEIQVLDEGFTEKYEKNTGKKGDWFTTHGDVFPVGQSKMTPFEPKSPNGSRSFPRKQLSRGTNQWNHYYVRAINGEVRLWVNGEEVSGGNQCQPATGHLCLESEGAPVEFRDLRLRVLP
ncbi:MAG: 3-keto-disaccharide hydrolase [Aureliella sp.]